MVRERQATTGWAPAHLVAYEVHLRGNAPADDLRQELRRVYGSLQSLQVSANLVMAATRAGSPYTPGAGRRHATIGRAPRTTHQWVVRVRQQDGCHRVSRERGALRGADQGVPHGAVLRQVHRRRQQVRESLRNSHDGSGIMTTNQPSVGEHKAVSPQLCAYPSCPCVRSEGGWTTQSAHT